MLHRNSKQITIFRSGSFLSRAQGADTLDFFSSSKRSIGSYWESPHSKKIGSGLTFAEEEILLPNIIDVPAEDREFRKKVTQFYMEIDTNVPYEVGRVLEIGLELDNNAPLKRDPKDPSKSNMPLNIMDYIRYRHALKHPQVSTNKELADGNVMIEFYIFDKTESLRKNSKKSDEKDAAYQIFLSIKPDIEKVKMMLTLLGKDPREFNTDSDAVTALRGIAENTPTVFTEMYATNNLEITYWIRTMVNTGILKIIGNKYFDAETDKLQANSLEELVHFFLDEDNSDVVRLLKARMQESLKKPLPKKGRNG